MFGHKVNTVLCLCICFSFQLRSVFSTTNRMKNRPLIIIEPQAHKKLNPSLVVTQGYECSISTNVKLNSRANSKESLLLFQYLTEKIANH